MNDTRKNMGAMNPLVVALVATLGSMALACDGGGDAPAATQPAPAAPDAKVGDSAHEHAAPEIKPAAHSHAAQANSGRLRLEDLPAELNPVQKEMRLLEDAMQHSLTIIANGNLQELPPTIFAVHEARNQTEQAIEAGTYKPPANSEDIEGFTKTDGAFHDDLVRMVKAAKANDRKAVTAAYADVVVGCTNCHQTYRPNF